MASDLLDLIRQKQTRITELRKELESAQSELEEAKRVLLGDGAIAAHATGLAKVGAAIAGAHLSWPEGEGSSVTLATRVLQRAGKPMHVEDIVREIEAQFHRRVLLDTLVGNISRMISRGKTVFVRKGPNVFGLCEWEERKQTAAPK
jgi:hypothetical protein